MSFMLPGWAASIMQWITTPPWLRIDEDKTNAVGDTWRTGTDPMRQPLADAHAHALRAIAGNQGTSVDAFDAAWNHPEGPHQNLQDGMTGTGVISTGLATTSCVGLGCKGASAVQLGITGAQVAQAVALSGFGGLAELPVIKEIGQTVLDRLQQTATNAILT